MTDIIPQNILNKSKQDKFILIIDTPKVLKDFQTKSIRSNSLLNLDKMQFSVVGVSVPPMDIPAVGLAYRGQTAHFTGQTRTEYSPAKINFTIDNQYDNYFFLYKWLEVLNNPMDSGMDSHFANFDSVEKTLNTIKNITKPNSITKTKYKEIKMQNSYEDYQTIISLIGLREYNEKIIKFNYYNAFITSLGGFEYDYKNPDDIACSFDFSFGRFTVELIDPV